MQHASLHCLVAYSLANKLLILHYNPVILIAMCVHYFVPIQKSVLRSSELHFAVVALYLDQSHICIVIQQVQRLVYY